jgi:hypothetical protein
VLAASPAELLQLQPVGRRFAILGLRIVPLFAIAALQRNNLSGHFKQLLDSGCYPSNRFNLVILRRFKPPKDLCKFFRGQKTASIATNPLIASS